MTEEKENTVAERRHYGKGERESREKYSVVSDVTCYSISLEKELEKTQSVVAELQQRIQTLEISAFAGGSRSKTEKLMKIRELCGLSEKVPISMVQKECSIRAPNHCRALMREAAELFKLVFFTGVRGQESYLSQKTPENKAMLAYAETYQELLGKELGTTITVSAIAHKYQLNSQETQSVVSHLCRHREFYFAHLKGRIGDGRIKRVK